MTLCGGVWPEACPSFAAPLLLSFRSQERGLLSCWLPACLPAESVACLPARLPQMVTAMARRLLRSTCRRRCWLVSGCFRLGES